MPEPIPELARLRTLLREAKEVISKAYCVACDTQAILRTRTDLQPTHSPMAELAAVEKAAGVMLAKIWAEERS